MKYYHMYVESADAPKRFNRELMIREDLSLFEIVFIILSSFNAEFEHLYLFEDQKYIYENASWVKDTFFTQLRRL